MKWLRELTEGDKLMGATSFSDGTKPRCQLTPPGGLQDFVNDPDNLDEWARNHRCWTEERNGVLRLRFECSHKPPQAPSKRPKPLRPLIRELTSWWAMLQDFLDRTGLIVQQQPFTLNRLPVIGLLATVLTILGGTAWILHNHLKAIKSQDNSIPLPSDLYLVIGVLVKASLTLDFNPIQIVAANPNPSLSTNALTAISVPCARFFQEAIHLHRLLQLRELQIQGQTQCPVHRLPHIETWKNTTQSLPSLLSTPHGSPVATYWYACPSGPLLRNFGLSSLVRCK